MVTVNESQKTNNGWLFFVSAEGNEYRVRLEEAYYRHLTKGAVTPERLVEASFEYLLERERPGDILSEFDLPVIRRYFPDYETEISRRL